MRAEARGRRPKGWAVRAEIAVPRASFEELEIRTSDGARIRAWVDEPPEGGSLRGTVVLAHALFARKSSFGRRDRPGLAARLARDGFRTIAIDFRGHGESVAPSDRGWGYDDLVRSDIPAVVEYARGREGGETLPLVVLGHSLGGHVALAAHAVGRAPVDALVLVAANVWLRDLERSTARWIAKLGVVRAMHALSQRADGIPARRLRLGTDDAGARAVDDLLRPTRTGTWTSSDGADDYLAALGDVTIPVAAVVGERDRLLCTPDAGERFVRRCAGPVEVFRADAGHMDLVTVEDGIGAVRRALGWALARGDRQARP